MQSTSDNKLHVAFIMDGNGRWAAARGLPRLAGHHAGVESVRRVVEAAPDLNIGTITLYAFSADNWQRSPEEVEGLIELFGHYLESEREECLMNGIRVRVIGRRDRLPAYVQAAIERTECETAAGRELTLRLAVDYSSRDAIVAAAGGSPASRDAFARVLGPPVDLLIRTGGEQRLSDFLLWECAYAELYFTSCMWPDFGREEFVAAMADFHSRERRFGAAGVTLPEPHTGALRETLHVVQK
jgi:undecaprenyl diphosphate synthase